MEKTPSLRKPIATCGSNRPVVKPLDTSPLPSVQRLSTENEAPAALKNEACVLVAEVRATANPCTRPAVIAFRIAEMLPKLVN